MAYTVRTTERDEQAIEKAKERLGEKSATKAMLTACDMLPKLQDWIKELELQLNMSETRFIRLRNAVSRKLEADKELEEAIEKARLPG